MGQYYYAGFRIARPRRDARHRRVAREKLAKSPWHGARVAREKPAKSPWRFARENLAKRPQILMASSAVSLILVRGAMTASKFAHSSEKAFAALAASR